MVPLGVDVGSRRVLKHGETVGVVAVVRRQGPFKLGDQPGALGVLFLEFIEECRGVRLAPPEGLEEVLLFLGVVQFVREYADVIEGRVQEVEVRFGPRRREGGHRVLEHFEDPVEVPVFGLDGLDRVGHASAACFPFEKFRRGAVPRDAAPRGDARALSTLLSHGAPLAYYRYIS